MSDLILPEDLAEAPSDDVGAFVHLERLARERYGYALRDARSMHDGDVQQCELDYMSAVLAAAQVYGVAELASWQLPTLGDESWWDHCRNFRAAVQHVAVKLLLHRHRQRDTFSVALDAATKLRLQHYVTQGRDLIGKESMPAPKRERLLGCLNAFQVELDRERTGLQVFGVLMCEAASYASEVAGRGEGFLRAVERIGAALGLSRQAEDERERSKQLPAPPERKRIEPPKKPAPKRPVFDKKIDDEIPF
jgi:hypothetical protein